MESMSDIVKDKQSPGSTERLEEVQDIIDRMPTRWTGWVALVVAIIFVALIILGIVIRYPDTITGQISITGKESPVRMVSMTSGRLHLLVNNHAEVQSGDCIGYIENSSQYEDIVSLDSICSNVLTPKSELNLPRGMQLGMLSTYYNDFSLTYDQYDRLRDTKLYNQMRQALISQQESDEAVAKNMFAEQDMANRILSSQQEQFCADSLLYMNGVISEEDLVTKKNGLLTAQQRIIEQKSSYLLKQSEIHAVSIELAKLDINASDELSTAYNTMTAKYNILCNELRKWKEQYLFIVPISGMVEYLGFWREHAFIPTGSEVFSVSPIDNQMVGELLIMANGAGKVCIGQDVNVKLLDYPTTEFGFIKGRVQSISTLTHKAELSGGVADMYCLLVEFPDGMTTNYGQQLILNYESKGIGEVITRKRRLIQRLFDNLKSIGNK